MGLISAEYKQMNAQMHRENEAYGKSSGKWVNAVIGLSAKFNCADILDYGCGKGLLKLGIGNKVREYDPSIEGKDATPEPADMVVCTDVLEHIEPELLDEVLNDIQRCTKQLAFLTVSTRPAKKILPDGRNAHLIQENADWWLPKLMERFELESFQAFNNEFLVVLRSK